MRKLTFILLLSAFLVLTSADFEDIIMHIQSVSTSPTKTGSSYKTVSLEGGAYIYIKGTGFSHKSANSNRVTLDADIDCPIVEFLTTNTQIVCIAPSFPKEKSVAVKVYSDEQRNDMCDGCLYYSYWATPQMTYMLPNAANPGAEIKYYGRQRVSTALDVDYVKIGAHRCDPTSQNDYDPITFDAGSFVSVPCNVPKMDAGYYSVSQKNLQSTGNAQKLSTLPIYRIGADAYDFAVVPRIDSISNNLGSTQGQIITVSGAGFSDDTVVTLDTTSCKILSQSSSQIQCELQPTSSAAFDKGFHSGLKFETFKGKDINSVRTTNPAAATQTSRLVAEIPMNTDDYYTSRLSGYFKAPTTGNYRFVLSADDKAELYVSSVPNSLDKSKLVKVVSVDSNTGYKFYFTHITTSQTSGDVALEADNFYYIELYHQEWTGSDYASLGVIIPGQLNDVNTKPDAQSIKINCPADLEVIEFALSNVSGGTWNIKLDYLSADGKKVDKSVRTSAMSYNTDASTVQTQFSSAYSYKTTVVKKMYKSDGSVTTTSSDAKKFVYQVTFNSFRKNGLLPVIEEELTGASKSTLVTQVTKPSDALKGNFLLKKGADMVEVPFNGYGLETKLRTLGFKDPIRISTLGEAELGYEWRVQFSGDNTGALPLLTAEDTLEGCKNQDEITVSVTKLQDGSRDLFYESIPLDYLFTAHTKPQVTVKSNGITANCPNFNCDYELKTAEVPEVQSATFSAPTLTLELSTLAGQYTQEKVRVFFGNTECTITSYASTVVANCPNPEAGDFIPRVHFEGIGYAQTASAVSAITVDAVISSVAPTSVNPNGGSPLVIQGTGFPASLALATLRNLAVKVGTSDCEITSVTATKIECTTSAVSADAPATVTLNGKTGTSSSSLTLMSVVPTINSITPTSVNPVLQTTIIINGANFDATAANTKIYLANATNPKVQECLVSSASTTQIQCKLLGAPSGNYKLTVRTSLGFANPVDFAVETVVTGVSPSSGSAAGGTVLTITGGAFSDDKQQSLVFIGDESIMCDVISSSETEVKCTTRAKSDTYALGAAQDVIVATRIVEESVCKNGGNSCSFTYSDALTPKVTTVDKTSVVGGDSLTITGTGFDSAPVVTLGGVSCTVTSATATQIVITIPKEVVPSKTAALVINIAGKGNAQFNTASTLTVSPSIKSISPTSGSTAGVLLTIQGAGFQQGTTVKVGSSTCEIKSLTSDTITCKATGSGDVSVTYGDFSGVKCSSGCNLGVSSNQTPVVSEATPAPSSNTFTLNISGSKFELGTVGVVLVSKKDKTATFTGSVSGTPTASSITASFTGVAGGSYALQVTSGANIASSSVTVEVPLTASLSGSAVDSSLAGGVTLSLTGSGFFGNSEKDRNQVTICGLPCKVLSSTDSTIDCQTPTFINSAVQTAYPNLVKSAVIKPASSWSDAGTESTVFDLAFTTIYTSTQAACEIGADFGAGVLAQVSEIKYFPNPAITSSKLAGTIIQGSNDKSTWSDVITIDANAHDGWNTIKLDTPSAYRYYRLSGGSSTAKCALAELQFYGVSLSDNTATNLNAIACKASVTVNDKTQEISATAVNYKESKTAVLSSISPDMGTTAGNTLLTFTGSGFGTTSGAVKVFIDDVECSVQSVTDSEIKCLTGAAPSISNRRNSLQSELRIEIAGQGNAIVNSIKYFYIDRWSEMSTWGGIVPPRAGESVSIPAGQTILLDISPEKLKAIIIEGALIFDDANINLHCEYILIRGGRLQIGTSDKPIQNKITVTLYGTKESPQLPTFGNKVIALMEGIIDIHGKPRSHTWTVLESTAAADATSIVVQGAVDWAAGEQIVIASTEHDHYQSESRTILTATKNSPSAGLTTITFAEKLTYKHYAGIQTIDGQTFEMRAEVGLLTRNVVIQGDETSEKNLYGVHIMSHSSTGDDSSIGRISYTEVRQAGQAFNLGRYPIHFHLIGNVRESYILGNAVHHTYNRAVTIHGVHFLKVQKNVAYWVMGHTIFIEDGIETHNVIEDNLVINTMASNALLNTDQTPASFWITNPKNTWRRNHAAGSDRYGFWFDLREHPEGPSATSTICPVGETLGEFVDNQAHSSGRYGLRIFHELIPRTYPCEPYEDYVANPPIQAEFKNFLGWKNMRDAIIGERLGAVKFKNIKAVDNLRAGIEISDGNWSPPDSLLVEDAWIVGLSPDNSADLSLYELDNPDKIVKGLITPKKDFFLAKNIHFSNFGDNFAAIETCSHCEHPAATTEGARTSFFEGLTFNNVKQRVNFNIPKKEILVDRDGSLVGTPGTPGVVTFFYDHLNVPGCTRDEVVYNGLVCDSTVTIRRVEFKENVPFASFEMMNVSLTRQENNNDNVIGQVFYRAKPNKSWAVPFVTGYSYLVNWNSRADWNELRANPSEVIQPSDKAITLIFNHTEYRETYDVLNYTSKAAFDNLTTLWDPVTDNNMNSGDWYHDTDKQLLYVAITGNQKTDLKLKAVKCRINCPIAGAPVPKDGVRLWSNATQWPNQQVPKDGDNVEIPANWAIVLDESTAKLKTLTVKGDLHFSSDKDGLILTAERIWVQGQMFIGNSSTERYANKATVRLTGKRLSEALLLDGIQYPSNKVLAVTGNLTMYGNEVSKPYVKLLAPAAVGATKIKVPTDTNWKVGDLIAISPSQRSETQFEHRTIVAISNGEITVDSPLSYYHFGAAGTTKTTAYGTIDMRAEVALLSRNILVEGTNEDSWGGRIFVAEIYSSDLDYFFRGKAELEGVEMRNLGQKDTDQAGLTFNKLTSDTNGPSTVTKCVMRDTDAWHLRVVSSDSLTFDDNVFYRSFKHQVVFDEKSSNIKFRRNLMVANQKRDVAIDSGDNVLDFSSTFMAKSGFTSSEVSDNIAAGCYQTCFTAPGGDCSSQAAGPYTMKNNVAHSGETGWLLPSPSGLCNHASHYTGFKLEQGLATFFNSKQVKASYVQITDTYIGVSLNTGGALGLTKTFLENSYIAGTSLTNDQYQNFESECSHLSGVFVTVATTASKTIPPSKSMLPWYKVKTEHIFESIFTVSDVTFADFHNNFARCSSNFAFQTNNYASDSSANVHINHVQLSNVGPENKIFFKEPDNAWIGLDDCGGYYCTGIKNVLIRDDGTLLGQPGKPTSLIPRNPGVLDTANCQFSEKQNTYICENKGWGILTFESMDIDVDTRILSPIKVTRDDGFSNILNTYMDHTWDGFYTGLKRYSRFHSVVQSSQDYKVAFTGTVPNGVRWQLQGAQDSETVTAEYGYATPQSVKILKDGYEIRPKIVPVANDKVLKTTDACGTNVFNLDTRKISLQLTGESDCKLEVVLINAISASVRYAISIEDFFKLDGPTKFIDNVAAILKINPASIRIVDVKSGSSIVHYTIAASNQGFDSASTEAARIELEEHIATLKSAIADGSFRVLDSEILDSSFDATYIRTETLYSDPSKGNTAETIVSGSDLTFIIIAACVAGVALIIGAYFAHLKYRRSKVAPLKVTELKKVPSNSSIQKIQDNTFLDSPLARINTRNMSVSPSPTAIITPSLMDDLSPEKKSPNSKEGVFEYKL